MDYEKKIREIINSNSEYYPSEDKAVFAKYFPELKEPEDERIRKAIHIYLDWLDGRKDYAPKGIYSIKDMIAWLEKQDKTLDADKVIAWLVANICDFDYYVKLFKKDFGLTEKGGKK